MKKAKQTRKTPRHHAHMRHAARSDAPLYTVRRSRIHGSGVYSARAIPKGTRIVEYLGDRITHAQADERYEAKGQDDGHTFLFVVSNRVVIDAGVDGNEARFINHSCDPNCDAIVEDERIWIETIRDVEQGEELAYDYAFVLKERHTPAAKKRFPCRCGSARCRGTMLAKKR